MTDQTETARAADAYSQFMHFTAEAHRRKWSYDQGLDDDGQPIKSEAFDALHRLGNEMLAALNKLDVARRAVTIPAPAADRAGLREQIATAVDGVFEAWRDGLGDVRPQDALVDAVLPLLPASVDRATVLREEAARIRAHCPDHLDAASADGAWMVCHCELADDLERRLAVEARDGQTTQDDDGPPAPLRRSEDDCPGFPEKCPNLRPVDPNPPVHLGGIRCGCADGPAGGAQQQPKEADGRLLCPRCGEDIADYDEDDHVWRTGDERPYCSGECVIAAHRAALKQQPKEARP